ncbi:crAss001_48 related protein [Pediococcus stilesii]|uniref:Uncharacterized protein n=1 Tax=Pediococcus stilesii TaxID=331679 RepID=A0A0R2L5M7_9LACO|nr:hypothetical protein [Pediococcus stilesii]KRN94570.1 hypothetical protein IV81_GL001206 [Pediococcus stilesii]
MLKEKVIAQLELESEKLERKMRRLSDVINDQYIGISDSHKAIMIDQYEAMRDYDNALYRRIRDIEGNYD